MNPGDDLGAWHALARTLAVLFASFAIFLGLALTSGALDSGFGAFEDEPSHFVSGLMVRDYLADGLGTHPLRYAEDYYLHYPKVAIGHWPPVWPGIEGLWMLAFGVSTFSFLCLMATLAGLTSGLIFLGVRRDTGDLIAAAAALVYPLLPLVQKFGHMAMTELPQALFCLAAVLAFGRYLETLRARWSVIFAVCAVLAILTKGGGIFLALVPPLAIVLSGRLEVLRRKSLWTAGVIVALLCTPWYVLTFKISRSTWGAGSAPSAAYVTEALPYYGLALFRLGGWVMGIIALVGLGFGASRGERRGRWAALLAWLPALLTCVLLVPTGIDERHLVLVAPVWIAGWAMGMAALGRLATGKRLEWAPLLPVLLVGAFFIEAFERARKDYRGFQGAATRLLADEQLAESAFLIASDSKGEGLFVAGVAMHEERPGHIVLRGSKVLATSDWMGRDYTPAFASADELAAFLAEVPVAIVAVDESTVRHHWRAHHDLLLEVMERDPTLWEPIEAYDVWRDGVVYDGALRLFRQAGHEERPLRLPRLREMLGREIPGF